MAPTTRASSQAAPTRSPAPAALNPAGLSTGLASTTSAASVWVLVDKTHPLQPVAFAPTDLRGVGRGQTLRADAAAALGRLEAAAGSAGVDVYAASGYRSYSTQVTVHAASVRAQGAEAADEVSARAGYSEHQTGWAVDLGTTGCDIEDCFASTAAGRWTAANAYRYGFVLRYPSGQQAVTGYTFEPWHFRYVGPRLALAMHLQGLTVLERALGYPASPRY